MERYTSLSVRRDASVLFVQLDVAEGRNTITPTLIAELTRVLNTCGASISVIVLEGAPEVFCVGVDFETLHARARAGQAMDVEPEALYALWQQLAEGPWVSIAHVRGRVNAGGVGFVAACDLVIADDAAVFSLSELLFGLFPACVMPFLVRRMGFQRAHYMTLMTSPLPVTQAQAWGLVDASAANSQDLVRKHLLRLRRLSPTAVARYKAYMTKVNGVIGALQEEAIAANREMFSEPDTIAKIARYVEEGLFPWE
uniref:Enoyl-CoA hydrolase-like n=1 Tax=uncultured bacterial symbiont of Discodermia dissoluta TaxID=323654 RepID=Q49HJ6_9BACT|nr:enoyl-CoA hydrolase-like [uncultured bacterial symbiont of Discodermia dissoluta]